MSAARPSDGQLSAKLTLALLALVSSRGARQPERTLIQDFAASYPAMWSRAANTLLLLTDMGVLVRSDDSAQLSNDWALLDTCQIQPSLQGAIAARLATAVRSRKGAFLQADSIQGGIWIDSMLLPSGLGGLPLWIIEFEVAERDCATSRFWRVSPTYEATLLASVRATNKALIQKSLSQQQLEAKLDRDALNGIEAEEWVLTYEKRRLRGHPFEDQIARVSDESVGAGYDIVSFSGPSVLSHDLYIEVKSFSVVRRFFWSRNEISTAQLMGEKYSLYLIDRSRMSEDGYEPQVIRGPYTALLSSVDTGWSMEPSSFEFSAASDD
jgi:hypothetical protein